MRASFTKVLILLFLIGKANASTDLNINHGQSLKFVFWYGCEYCYGIKDDLEEIARNSNITLEFVTAPLNEAWANHAKLYYVIERLNLGERAHRAAYESVIRSRGRSLSQPGEALSFLQSLGVSEAEASSALRSKSVIDSVKQDYWALKDLNISVVPSFVYPNDYVMDGYTAGGINNVIKEIKGSIR